MRPQILDVDGLQSAVAERFQYLADVHQFPAWEYVLLDEIAHAAAELGVIGAAGRNAVVHHQAARAQEPADFREISGQLGAPDMLEHPDRCDFVERPGFFQLAVIQQYHPDAVLEPLFLDQAVDVRMLVLGQSDAGGVDAVVFGRPQQQAAPSRADVQETLAFVQPQLAADMVELGFLRLRQRHAGIAVIGA